MQPDKSNNLFRQIAASEDLFEASERIGKKFSLHIDQVGELDAEIRDILNGASRSADFVPHIIERLEIDRPLAEKIVQEVNTVVFDAIKKQLQQQGDSEKATSDIAAIEKAGGFTIEKSDDMADRKTGITQIETRDSLHVVGGIDIEDAATDPEPDHPHHEHPAPEHLPGETTEPVLGIKDADIPVEDDHNDPVAAHLMSHPVASPQQKTTADRPVLDRPKNDPYHEAI